MMRWNRGFRACYCYAEFTDEPIAGFYERQVAIVLYEADSVAPLATDEAFEDVLLFVDMHRRMFVIVIPAESTTAIGTYTIEADAQSGADLENRELS